MKYVVQVEITSCRTKEITVYAKNEREAMEKAEELVSEWDGVEDAKAIGADEA